MEYTNYIDKKNIKKILVIKCRALGDVLLSTPVFTNLKNYFHAEIDAFIYSDSLEILKNNQYINNIISYDLSIKKLNFFKKIVKEIKFILKVRKKNYDLIINLTEGDRGDILAFFSKAKYKIGQKSHKKKFFKKFTHLVKIPPTKRHQVELHLDFLRVLNIPIYNKDLIFNISKSSEDNILNYLKKNNIEKYILIHPNTRWQFKRFNKFDKIIKHFLNQNKKVIVVSGSSKSELEYIEDLIKGLDVYNISGKTNIEELGALIKYAEKIFTVDSFAFHLSNVFKKKVYAFFGPTCDIKWGGWQNPNCKVITSKISCRPCHMDGCGGSKISQCLNSIELENIGIIDIEKKLHAKVLT